MNGKLTLDRDAFKVLASDTRVEILKKLDERKKTLSDLAEEMDMSPSTIKEHLDRLLEAGLIKQLDRDTKWKYYVLTGKGKSIVSPSETRVWILLSTSVAALAAIAFDILYRLFQAGGRTMAAASEVKKPMLAEAAHKTANNTADVAARSLPPASTSTILQEAQEAVSFLPWWEILLAVLALAVFTVTLVIIVRRRVKFKL